MVFPPREDSGATLALAASVCALSLLAVIVSVCGVISGAMYPELEPVSVVGWEFRLFLLGHGRLTQLNAAHFQPMFLSFPY